jgi:hypothetical protein
MHRIPASMDRENFISIALLLQINKNGPMTRENAWNPHFRIVYLILPFTVPLCITNAQK